MTLFKNPFFLGFLGLYILAVALLVTNGVYSPAEPLFMLAIFGVILPAVAYFFCRKCTPLFIPGGIKHGEIVLMTLCVLGVMAYLVWGSEALDQIVFGLIEDTPRSRFFVDIGKKLLVFVIIPYLLFSRMFGYGWKDFGFSSKLRTVLAARYLALIGAMMLIYFLVQYLVGQGAKPLFSGQYPLTSILLGAGLLFPLLILEVGLVEEFFFRGIVQSRLAVWSGSEISGLVMMAAVFGIAHAPGIYLRGAGTVTMLGDQPGMLVTLAYSIAVIALAGLAFGVIWAKTRNMLVLIIIHAWVDLLPLLPEFLDIFSL